MGTNRQTLLDDFSTLMTFLAGETRGHSNDFMPSTCSLGTEKIEERAPTGVHDALGKMVIFHHVPDSQVFNSNVVIAFGIRFSCLEVVISPLTMDLEMCLGGVLGSLPASMAAFLAAAQLTLLASQRLLRCPIEARVLNGLALAIRQERFQTHINANITVLAGAGKVFMLWVRLTDDQRIPMSIGSQDKMHGLRSALDLAMQLDLEDMSQFLGNNQVVLVFVQRAVFAILTKLDGMPVGALFEARETSFQSKLFAGKKPLEGLGETIGQHLDGCGGDRLLATAFELCGQIVLCREGAFVLILHFHGLKHLVIDEARLTQTLHKQGILLLIDKKAILKRFHDSNHNELESICQQFRPPAVKTVDNEAVVVLALPRDKLTYYLAQTRNAMIVFARQVINGP
jgi:hypothetical protein